MRAASSYVSEVVSATFSGTLRIIMLSTFPELVWEADSIMTLVGATRGTLLAPLASDEELEQAASAKARPTLAPHRERDVPGKESLSLVVIGI